MKSSFSIAVLLMLAASTGAQNYCAEERCNRMGVKQTMCLYSNPNPSSACGKVASTGVTNSEKAEIVNKHNELRRYVASGQEKRGNPGPQPRATNMETMTWDDELAKVAQRWANQCQFGHDKCRNVARFSVGQNVGIRSTTGADKSKPSDVIQSWYNEVAYMNKAQVSSLKSIDKVGHYTQLVWATSNKIGCGQVRYNKDGWNSYYLVCNYGPTGNWINQPVYKT